MSALSFSRSKLVGVETSGENMLKAHGVLEDNIYAMEMDVTINLKDFRIAAISGKMNRITTSECHRALDILQNAIGMEITDREFARTVNRVIGRAGCLHLGALLVECCDSILQAAIFKDIENPSAPYKGNPAEYAAQKMKTVPNLEGSCLTYISGQ
jgi:hypothetical protein